MLLSFFAIHHQLSRPIIIVSTTVVGTGRQSSRWVLGKDMNSIVLQCTSVYFSVTADNNHQHECQGVISQGSCVLWHYLLLAPMLTAMLCTLFYVYMRFSDQWYTMLNRSGFLIGQQARALNWRWCWWWYDDAAADYNYSYANDDCGEPDDDDQDGQRQQYFRWRRTVGAD